KISTVVDNVEPAAVDNGRRVAAAYTLDRPLDLILSECTFSRCVDCSDETHFIAVEVFFAVRCEHGCSADHCAVVDAAFGDGTMSDRLPSLNLHRIHGAVSAADYEQAHAVYGGDDGRRIDGIVGPATRRARPHALTVVLVESKEPML